MPISALSKPKNLQAQTEAVSAKTLAPSVQSFLLNLQKKGSSERDGQTIHVSSVVSGAAALYERLRYSLDYREEHLLRRHAIERIIRRQLDYQNGFKDYARPFLVELVQAQYLKNDTVPEAAIAKVQSILDKYSALLTLADEKANNEKKALKNWLLGLLSAELDDELAPAPEDQALVGLMVSHVIKDSALENWPLSSEERERQVFIACYRALYAFDPQTLHFFLLLRWMPNWRSLSSAEAAALWPKVALQRLVVEEALRHPAGAKLYRSIKSKAIVFHALKDIMIKNQSSLSALLVDEGKFYAMLEETCRHYYAGARRRLYRSAVRATIYIFLTKIILALAAEAPVEQFLYGAVATGPLFINTVFPPALMFLLTATTRFPGVVNTKQVWQIMSTLLYGGEGRIFPRVKYVAKSSALLTIIFSLFYLFTFTITFGAIIVMLQKFNFTLVSLAFFLFFLSIVSFFAIRIRQPVRDLFVMSPRENIILVLINFFSLPILRVGQVISLTSARFNVFLYLFDYLLEAPFKSFLAVFEDVLGFFREQREEIV